MSDQELIASFLSSNHPTRVPPGRRVYSRRAIVAIAEGPDFKLTQLRQDQAAGRLDWRGRKVRS